MRTPNIGRNHHCPEGQGERSGGGGAQGSRGHCLQGKFFREGNSTKAPKGRSSAGEGEGRGGKADAVEPGQGWSSSSGSRSGGLARRGRGAGGRRRQHASSPVDGLREGQKQGEEMGHGHRQEEEPTDICNVQLSVVVLTYFSS